MSEQPRPNFFVVGAPKAGTTSMATYLDLHPQIFMAYRKEMHYFATDLTRHPHYFFVLDEEKYLSYFRPAAGFKLVGEASVMYLMSKNAAQEIKTFNPEARIIIMLRNPVDVLYSYHSQLLWGAYEDIADFGAALEAEPARRRGENIPATCMMPEALYYSEVGRFAGQVERYFDVFGRENVHVIVYDDFKEDVQREYHRTLHFLGANLMDPPKFRRVNPNKEVRSRKIAQWLRRPPLPGRALFAALPDKFGYWLHGKLARVNTRLVSRQPLPEALRVRLSQEFADDTRRLGKLLDRNLDHWVEG